MVSGLKRAIEDERDDDEGDALAQWKDPNDDKGPGDSGNGVEGAQNEKPPVNLTDGYTGATGVGYTLVKMLSESLPLRSQWRLS